MKSRSIVYDGRANQEDLRSVGASSVGSKVLTASKYELAKAIAGQAVGGPGYKNKISMWDMMTLYDTHKKKVEEREAFLAHKQGQRELKSFYDDQIDFKKQVRAHEEQIKNQELEDIRIHHEKLGLHEDNF